MKKQSTGTSLVSINAADLLPLLAKANDGALTVSSAIAEIIARCESKSSSARVTSRGSKGQKRVTDTALTRAGVIPSAPISESYRTRLPKVLFHAGEGRLFEYIVLISPDGTEHEITCDAEGRSRCPSAWFGGDAGQIAEFHAVDAGVFQVNVTGESVDPDDDARRTTREERSRGTRTTSLTPARPVASVTRALDEAFAAPNNAGTRGRGDGKGHNKKPPTQAQLDARSRFATQNRVVKCARCKTGVRIGETEETAEGRLCSVCLGQLAHATRAQRYTTGGQRSRAIRTLPRVDRAGSRGGQYTQSELNQSAASRDASRTVRVLKASQRDSAGRGIVAPTFRSK